MTRYGRRTSALVATAILAALTLSGCGSTKRTFGLEKEAPDEFVVVQRAPLELPPDYALRPPRPGAPRPQEQRVSEQARDTVFGTTTTATAQTGNGGLVPAPGAPSAAPQVAVVRTTPGESALLSRVGVGEADPNIRRTIDRESATMVNAERSFLNTLLGFGSDPEPSGTVVDAPAEARRLRENQALGRPVTAGRTPQIERDSGSFLQSIF